MTSSRESWVEHRQVQVPGLGFEVDAGLVDLIAFLWRRGVKTEFSCENEPGKDRGYIYFPGYTDFTRAIQLITDLAAAHNEWFLRARALRMPYTAPPYAPEYKVFEHEQRWFYEVDVVTGDSRGTPAAPVFVFILRIPSADIECLNHLGRHANNVSSDWPPPWPASPSLSTRESAS